MPIRWSDLVSDSFCSDIFWPVKKIGQLTNGLKGEPSSANGSVLGLGPRGSEFESRYCYTRHCTFPPLFRYVNGPACALHTVLSGGAGCVSACVRRATPRAEGSVSSDDRVLDGSIAQAKGSGSGERREWLLLLLHHLVVRLTGMIEVNQVV